MSQEVTQILNFQIKTKILRKINHLLKKDKTLLSIHRKGIANTAKKNSKTLVNSKGT